MSEIVVVAPSPASPLARALPETRERCCPACRSERVVHAGHVITTGGIIRAEHRCEACGAGFWFVRKRVA